MRYSFREYFHAEGKKICLQRQLRAAMPNPSIPSSSSSCIVSKTKLPSSAPSACSSLPWHKKVRRKLVFVGRNNNNLSKHSDLTEESLEEHRKKTSDPSPYYKGLTDSTLFINRQRGPGSPSKESHATTVGTTSSLATTIIIKFQQWSSSCFTFKSRQLDDNIKHQAKAVSSSSSSPSSSKIRRTVLTAVREESGSLGPSNDGLSAVLEKPLGERVSEVRILPQKRVVFVEKPLGERVSEVEVPGRIVLQKRGAFSGDNSAKMNGENDKKDDFAWADLYRPKALENFICNRDKAVQLQDLAKMKKCHHFILEGLPGVGKRTMMCAFLREFFGHDEIETREEYMEFDLKGESVGSIVVNVKKSAYHIEVNLSQLRGYEKQIIVKLFEQTGGSNTLQNRQNVQRNQHNCRAIVLYEAEKLSTDAQLYFRWLLERMYNGGNMVFFSCSDISKLQPIRSLCTVIQLLPPSNEEIVQVLELIARQESINLPGPLADKIATNSKNNLRQAIRSFEATRKFNYPFKEDQEIRTGWEEDIAQIAKDIIEEQSPKQLYIIRGKLQKLTEHSISSEFIYKTLVSELKKHLDCSSIQFQFDNIFEDYYRDDVSLNDTERAFARNRHEEMGKRLNDSMRKNTHDVLKIEESIAKFMSCYKSISMTTKAGE